MVLFLLQYQNCIEVELRLTESPQYRVQEARLIIKDGHMLQSQYNATKSPRVIPAISHNTTSITDLMVRSLTSHSTSPRPSVFMKRVLLGPSAAGMLFQ